jgi:hypothetical protein
MLKWKYTKVLKWVSLIIMATVPLIGLSWLIFQFNLPYLNGGDKTVIRFALLIWWCSCTLVIYGFRLKT